MLASAWATAKAEELLPCPGSDSCRPHLQWGAFHSVICPHAHRPAVAAALDEAEARGASRLKDIEAERDRLLERERGFAKALKVADGGQYRNDWPGAMERLIRDRDEALASASRLRERIRERSNWNPSRHRLTATCAP